MRVDFPCGFGQRIQPEKNTTALPRIRRIKKKEKKEKTLLIGDGERACRFREVTVWKTLKINFFFKALFNEFSFARIFCFVFSKYFLEKTPSKKQEEERRESCFESWESEERGARGHFTCALSSVTLDERTRTREREERRQRASPAGRKATCLEALHKSHPHKCVWCAFPLSTPSFSPLTLLFPS